MNHVVPSWRLNSNDSHPLEAGVKFAVFASIIATYVITHTNRTSTARFTF